MQAGVAAFKIEGRARNPEYVKTVVGAYRSAIDAVMDGQFTPDLAKQLTAQCARVYHRPFSTGLYHGRPGEAQFSDTDQNQATEVKHYAGIIVNYFADAGVAHVLIHNHTLCVGDTIAIHGPTTGVVDLRVDTLQRDKEVLASVSKPQWATFPCPQKIRRSDKVYVIKPRSEPR